MARRRTTSITGQSLGCDEEIPSLSIGCDEYLSRQGKLVLSLHGSRRVNSPFAMERGRDPIGGAFGAEMEMGSGRSS